MQDITKRHISIIAMVTSDCNLDCWYCYTKASRCSVDKWDHRYLKKIIENCSDGFKYVEFCWHGGEPLLMGREFYGDVIAIQNELSKKKGVEFQNNIQTNGTLLNDEWIDFLVAHEFRIGLSLDAPLHIHIKNRKNDPFQLLDICHTFQKKNIPLGVLCVITKENVKLVDGIFDFYKKLNVNSFGLLPLRKVGNINESLVPTNEEVFELYKEMFDKWVWSDNDFYSIEPLDSMLHLILGRNCAICSFTSPCLERMISIDQEGNVIPCSSLVASEFKLGVIYEDKLISILENDKTRNFKELKKKALLQNCKGCIFLNLCNGGCRADAFWSTKQYTGAYPFCEARKRMFQYIQEQMPLIMSQVKKNNSTKTG